MASVAGVGPREVDIDIDIAGGHGDVVAVAVVVGVVVGFAFVVGTDGKTGTVILSDSGEVAVVGFSLARKADIAEVADVAEMVIGTVRAVAENVGVEIVVLGVAGVVVFAWPRVGAVPSPGRCEYLLLTR